MRTRAGDARVTFAVFSWIPVPAGQPLCDERPDPATQAHMQPISIRSIDRGWYYVAVDGARPVGLGAWVRSMGCNILSATCRSIDSRVPALSTPRTRSEEHTSELQYLMRIP